MDNLSLGSFKVLENVHLKATYDIEVNGIQFKTGETIAIFDKIQISNFNQIKDYVAARGGLDNRGHVFWETTRAIQFSFSQGVFSNTQFGLLTNSKVIKIDKEQPLLITFDDGYTSTYKYALPLLEKYKYNSVVFCIGKLTKDKTKAFDPSVLQYMGYDLINDIKKNHPILKIGAHSNKLHDDSFYKYSYEQIYDDVLTVKNNLNTDLYSYPGGHYNNNYLKAVKNAGYKLVFKYKPSSKTYITDSKYAVSRIEVDGNLGMKGFVDIFKQGKPYFFIKIKRLCLLS